MSTSTREKIIEYLAAGVSQAVAAEAAGVTPAYVSQLLELEDVREELAVKKAGKLEAAIQADDSVEEAERLALKRTIHQLQWTKSATESAKVFQIMNSARRKAEEGGSKESHGAQTVTLVLPKAARVMVQINPDNQIIEVDGRTTAPLPSKVLPSLQKQLAAQTLELGAPAITDVKERMKVADTSRAHAVLADLTTTLNGVEIVI